MVTRASIMHPYACINIQAYTNTHIYVQLLHTHMYEYICIHMYVYIRW